MGRTVQQSYANITIDEAACYVMSPDVLERTYPIGQLYISNSMVECPRTPFR